MWPFTGLSGSKLEAQSTLPMSAHPGAQQYDPTEEPQVTEISKNITHQQKQSPDEDELRRPRDDRLGMVFPLRAILLLGASFIGGATLGAAKGSSIAADRYRAENAHRLPTTTNGWFLYHKSKNYHSMLGGMKEGAKFGTVLMSWAFMFMVTEEVVDQSRSRLFARGDDEQATGQRDAASTVISAMTVAGAYSWKQGFDQFAAARTARMALKYSLAYGLVQDALATLRGSRPAYISWIASKVSRSSSEVEKV